ncbi:MAG TPA: hypothetical protein VEI02_00965 [Planctomycetota bacterium]|nr:hypothetical protein [Planctomycetota bacterium]
MSTPDARDDHTQAPERLLAEGFCPHLKTKSMYIGFALRRRPDFEGHGTAIFWCGRTQLGFGPDAQPALPENCVPGRACCPVPKVEV